MTARASFVRVRVLAIPASVLRLESSASMQRSGALASALQTPPSQQAPRCSWQDEAGSRLESRIGEIAVALIVAGEAAFRRRLKEAEIRDEQERIERLRREEEARKERERQRLEHIRKQNEQRIADLRMSGELLRQSQDLRALVVAVRLAMQQRADVTTQSLSAWEEWALGEADKLDPILSGQIMSHLYPPVPPAEEMQ